MHDLGPFATMKEKIFSTTHICLKLNIFSLISIGEFKNPLSYFLPIEN